MREVVENKPAKLEEIKSLILKEFAEANVEDIQEQSDHRIVGSIIWPGFKKMDVSTRNRMVTEKVRNTLGLRGLNIGILFPLAPGEKL